MYLDNQIIKKTKQKNNNCLLELPISVFQANYFQFFLWWHFPMMSVPLKPILWGVFAFPKTTVVQRVELHQDRVHPVLEFAVYSSKQFLKFDAPLQCKRSFYYRKKQFLSCNKLNPGHHSIKLFGDFLVLSIFSGYSEGRLISEWVFGVFKSSKKWTFS